MLNTERKKKPKANSIRNLFWKLGEEEKQEEEKKRNKPNKL